MSRIVEMVGGPTGDESTDQVIELLAAFANMLDAKTIVEAGTHRGRTARALARLCPQAHVWTADPYDHKPVIDCPNLTYVRDRYEAMLTQVPGAIDLAFIDASDTIKLECPRLEYVQLTLPRMSPEGLIVVDDTASPDWPGATDIIAMGSLRFTHYHGVTVIQR